MKFVDYDDDDDDDGISECSSLCPSDYFQFRQLRPIAKSVTEDAAKTSSHLDYCNRLPFRQPDAATPVGSERACRLQALEQEDKNTPRISVQNLRFRSNAVSLTQNFR